jgi:hypothetical protein
MLYFRAWKIRAGFTYGEVGGWPWENINFALVKQNMIDYAKKYTHLIILLTLKIWIKTTYFLHRKTKHVGAGLKKIKEKVNIFPENILLPEEEKKNKKGLPEFIKRVNAYKERLGNISKRMKEKEIKKIKEIEKSKSEEIKLLENKKEEFLPNPLSVPEIEKDTEIENL